MGVKSNVTGLDSVLDKKHGSKDDGLQEKHSLLSGFNVAWQALCGGARTKEMDKITRETVSVVQY